MNAGPMSRYQTALAAGMQVDPAQAEAVTALQALAARLSASPASGRLHRALTRLGLRQSRPVTGLYLWGGVGRGKTWLMDLFVDSLPPAVPHRRVHFHRYMHGVHRRLKQLGQTRDPLRVIAAEQARDMRVLCFDEFHVVDIADAMLLAGLIQALLKQSVALVATSNLQPGDLYRDGLQRARFLPTIELLRRHCQVLHVDGGVDYRLRLLEQAEIYHHPLDADAEANLSRYFDGLESDHHHSVSSVEINGREIDLRRLGDGVVWFEYDSLCVDARATEDYIEIAREFHTVLLSGVLCMDGSMDDAARRFINLVDEFYDRNVKLILSAAVPLDDLYLGSRLGFEFQRTRSRLEEMQSLEYLARPHLP
jgi:cell division protein ZapE